MATKSQDRDSIVSDAVEIRSAEERDAFIARACGEDAELQQQVKEQVERHFQAQSDNAAQEDGGGQEGGGRPGPRRGEGGAGHTESGEVSLTRIGPYKVLKLIREGPTGIVFRAEQQEPVRRQVALEVIKEGMDWQQMIARFEAQRPLLERMDHPNVARLLDAGTRQSGQPYLVWEWVEGTPITAYCDEEKLALQQRLELFVSACQAVQALHQKGILHGDLEPSNVLVAEREDRPVVKVVGAGVISATNGKPPLSTSADEPASAAGSVQYLSPEQADANVEDVDTRSDVYSLGVLLYELLTGTTPLLADRLEDASSAKALQMVREEETPPPSKRLDEMKDHLSEAAEQRGMQPKAMGKALHGELDSIALKALHKDRKRRYETAGDLARDVQRYLAHEPVEAYPLRPRQRLWKLMQKHSRASMIAAVTLALLLIAAVAGIGLALWAFHKEHQAQQAQQEAIAGQKKAEKGEEDTKGKLRQVEEARKATAEERDKARAAEKAAERSEEDARAILTFLKERLLSAGRPSDVELASVFWNETVGKDKDITLRKAVDGAADKVGEVFTDRPVAEATTRELLGLSYLNLGEPKLAVHQYERALELRKAIQGVNDNDTAECRNKLAVAYRLAGRTEEAGRLFEQKPDSPGHASALALRGSMLLSEKKYAEAELKLRQCLTLRQKNQPDDWTTFDTKSLLGEALLEQKKYAEAEPMLLSGYEGMSRHQDQMPRDSRGHLTRALQRLVRLYEGWGKADKAAEWRKVLETAEVPRKSS